MYFEYRVKFFNEVENLIKTAKGITYANSYAEAIDNITQFYGDKETDEIKINVADVDYVYELKNGDE